MSGNQFPNSVTWHVITYSFLFTLGLLSKFHGLHLVFAFRELKKKKKIYHVSITLSNPSWFHKLLHYPTHHLCSRLKISHLFTLLIQKPIRLCHPSQHLSLLHLPWEAMTRAAHGIHRVGKSWISTAEALCFVLHSLPNSLQHHVWLSDCCWLLRWSFCGIILRPTGISSLDCNNSFFFFSPPQHCFVVTNTELPFCHR